ncbi:EamA family transporter [Bizionia argentinensis JUB59]|uniref:EamA family transporter n=1 Tax=Bizionia argentinensis JUB59 TaxID=1046627 RepID=G2E9P9_9FLAO|nr:EamA family transporter [Bizionia argentinensis]EGV44988.1 EamA family transporter [Bizionia argentinensis JUB59]
MNTTKHYVAVTLAFTIWGFFSLVLRPLSDFTAFDILSYRSIVAAAIMLVVTLFFRPKVLKRNLALFKSLEKKERIRIFFINAFSGFFLALNWYIFIYVMNNVSVGATALAYLICPILTMVLAYMVLKEKLFKLQWFSVFLSLTACILLSLGNLSDFLYSMVIAFTYAIYLVLQRRNKEMDRFLILTVQIVFAVIILSPFFLTYDFETPKTNYFYSMIALIAVGFTIIPMFLNIYALRGLNSSVVGVFIYLNPLINFFLAVFYFKESFTLLQALSYGLIIISIIIFNIPALKHRINRRRAAHIQ